MFNYLEIITVISTIMLIRSGTEENLEKKRELWRYIKEKISACSTICGLESSEIR